MESVLLKVLGAEVSDLVQLEAITAHILTLRPEPGEVKIALSSLDVHNHTLAFLRLLFVLFFFFFSLLSSSSSSSRPDEAPTITGNTFTKTMRISITSSLHSSSMVKSPICVSMSLLVCTFFFFFLQAFPDNLSSLLSFLLFTLDDFGP